ncbi:MAG TPA: hypothetical protein VEK11_10795 [Thermoanaerobaculia bacterium]|nr:hypothetical protein [Thermoanaerobaculia bacterium]
MIHIHNGDVVAVAASRAGIPGEHLPYRESLVTGPVVPGDDWIETRARSITDAHGEDLLRVRTQLMEQEQALEAAPSQGEIVLWFEHDLYCLVHLVYLLQRFADARVSVVWCPTPLSESDERGLYNLFESRAAVLPTMTSAAREAWRAYTSADPTALNAFLGQDTPDFPFLRDGLLLHASRFPWTTNGLGAIEQRALTHIANGFSDFATIFDHMNAEVPRFGFGDTEVFRHLRAMATRPVPLITLSGDAPKAICTITPAGENVLRGTVDDLTINDPDLWLGGAHLTKEHVWRFDGLRLSPSAV